MVRFIEQEANEKYEEILDQTNQELEAWKNEFKHNKRSMACFRSLSSVFLIFLHRIPNSALFSYADVCFGFE